MMRATAKLGDAEKVSLTMTITATVEEWRAIKAELPNKWPQWQLGSVIDSALRRMLAQVDSEPEMKP